MRGFFRSLRNLSAPFPGENRPGRRDAERRGAARPYLAFLPPRFAARCLRSARSPLRAGEGAPAAGPPPPVGARSRRRGCPRSAPLRTGGTSRAEPFFFFSSLLPPFPSSLPPSLSFPLSLLSLPFSLSLSCIQGWHSEPLCIYVHNKAARPLHFICIITISVQAHHIVCCLHLLLRLLSQSTRLDFHILNELILYQHNARSHPRRWERGSSARSSAPLLRHRTPRKVWWGGGALCGVNYGY